MEQPHPEWDVLGHDEKLALIRAVAEAEVAPALAHDGGGVDIVDLSEGNRVTIAYRGACACCPMALFGTLGFIQQVLTSKVHPSLVVVPSLPSVGDDSLRNGQNSAVIRPQQQESIFSPSFNDPFDHA